MEKRVSVIIPCFNGQKYLDSSIRSVYDQDWPNIELILIDDGSTDGSREIVSNWEEAFREKGLILKYVYQCNQGPGAAVSRGLKEVTGEYLCLLDADDYYLPRSISLKADYLDNHPECSLVRSNGYMEKDGKRWLFVFEKAEKESTDVFGLLIEGKTNNWAGSYMLRTKKLFEFYPDRSIYPSRYGQNLQLLLPVCKDSQCGFIDQPLMVYRLDTNSLSREDDLIKKKAKSLRNADGYHDIRMHMVDVLFDTEEEKMIWNKRVNALYHKNRLRIGIESGDLQLAGEEYRELKRSKQLDLDSKIVYWNKKNKPVGIALRALRKMANYLNN